MFEPGDRVVPITFESGCFEPGVIYTVEAFYPAGHVEPGVRVCLISDAVTIVGVPYPYHPNKFGWAAHCFRKIEPRTDLMERLIARPKREDERDKLVKRRRVKA